MLTKYFTTCVLCFAASALRVPPPAEDGEWDLLKAANLIPAWARSSNGTVAMHRIRRAEASAAAPRERVAILTSGTVKRYMLGHATKGLIEPLVRQGHAVDYFLALNAAGFSPWQPQADDFAPELKGSVSSMEELIRHRVSESGGNIRHLEISRRVALNEDDENLIRTSEIRGLRNLLMKNKKLEELWRKLQASEGDGGQYTTVIIIDDDSIWLEPFDLDRLHCSSDRLAPEGYTLDCSAEMHGKAGVMLSPEMFNDFIWVVDREVAEPFGNQYSLLLRDATYRHAINDETFVGQLIQRHNISMHRRPPGLIPMQRGGHERNQKTGELEICLHKLCDGEWEQEGVSYPYMRPLRSMNACKTLASRPQFQALGNY